MVGLTSICACGPARDYQVTMGLVDLIPKYSRRTDARGTSTSVAWEVPVTVARGACRHSLWTRATLPSDDRDGRGALGYRLRLLSTAPPCGGVHSAGVLLFADVGMFLGDGAGATGGLNLRVGSDLWGPFVGTYYERDLQGARNAVTILAGLAASIPVAVPPQPAE